MIPLFFEVHRNRPISQTEVFLFHWLPVVHEVASIHRFVSYSFCVCSLGNLVASFEYESILPFRIVALHRSSLNQELADRALYRELSQFSQVRASALVCCFVISLGQMCVVFDFVFLVCCSAFEIQVRFCQLVLAP